MATKEPLSSKKYIDGIYIPAGLLVFGTFIVKREWVPYAVVLALALGALKFFRNRKSAVYHLCPSQADNAHTNRGMHSVVEPKKALKPDIFQEYELKEKTILSHNTAM